MISTIKKIFIFNLTLISLSAFSQESFILNYEDVDIKKVTQDIANFSRKTIILDPRVKGKVTIFSNSSLSSDEVWDVYLRTIQYISPVPALLLHFHTRLLASICWLHLEIAICYILYLEARHYL